MRASCLLVGAVLSIAALQHAEAAGLYTETFPTNVAGWQDRDAFEMTVTNDPSLGNPGGCLQGTFADTGGFPAFDIDAFVATGNLESASFTGNYDTADAMLIGFDFEATPGAPSYVRLKVTADTNAITRTWRETNLVNTLVRAIAASAVTNVYVGGLFSMQTGTNTAHNIARWDGTDWHALGPGLADRVNALAMDSAGFLYAGGSFTNAGSSNISYVARWDGVSWTGLGSGIGAAVTALVVDTSGNVYVGGVFTNAGAVAVQNVAKWDGASWSALGVGPGLGIEGPVGALAVSTAGVLVAGGQFTNAGSLALSYVARWDGVNWTNMHVGLSNRVNALAFEPGGTLYAGGGFEPNQIARWSGTNWVQAGFDTKGTVFALAASSTTNIYLAGNFKNLSRVMVAKSANNLAAWLTMGTGLGGPGYALCIVDHTNVFVGGDFCLAGSSNANRAARWDGSTWSAMTNGIHRWHQLAVTLMSAGLDQWTGNTEIFGEILTNVTSVQIEISRGSEFAEMYRVDNIFLARLPQAVAMDAAQGQLTWQELRTNWTYRLEATTQVLDSAWATLTSFPATNGAMTVTDTNAAPATGSRFYRLITE